MQLTEPDMCCKSIQRVAVAIILIVLASVLAGCVYPQGYSDWQWKQYNPEYQPLPGDAPR